LQVDIRAEELKYFGISTTMWNERKIIRYMFLYHTDQEKFDVLEGKGGHWLTFDEARERLDDKDRFDEIAGRIKKVEQKQ